MKVLIVTDSHGRWLQEEMQRLLPHAAVEVIFKPGGTLPVMEQVFHRRGGRYYDHVVLHCGSNDMSRRDGSKILGAKALMVRVSETVSIITRLFPTALLHVSGVLPRVGSKWHNDAVRWMGRHPEFAGVDGVRVRDAKTPTELGQDQTALVNADRLQRQRSVTDALHLQMLQTLRVIRDRVSERVSESV